jgi:hypothetical protein
MADRGQITGALLDGPLAFDNAISPEAAREKGLTSAVAGRADIVVVPDLVSGNILAKQLTFLAGADAADVVGRRARSHRSDQSGRFGERADLFLRCGGADGRRSRNKGKPSTAMTGTVLTLNAGFGEPEVRAVRGFGRRSPTSVSWSDQRPGRACPVAGERLRRRRCHGRGLRQGPR